MEDEILSQGGKKMDGIGNDIDTPVDGDVEIVEPGK